MYCPQCRAEYRNEFKRCSDCDLDLVEELSPYAVTSTLSPWDTDLVILIETDNMVLVSLLKQKLEDSGVGYATDRVSLWGGWGKVNSAGGSYGSGPIKLMVLKMNAGKAVEVLKSIQMDMTE